MGILGFFIAALLNLVLVAVDVTIFFILARALRVRLDWDFLRRFDDVGRPLTDAVAARMKGTLRLACGEPVTERGALAFSLVALSLLRLILGAAMVAIA